MAEKLTNEQIAPDKLLADLQWLLTEGERLAASWGTEQPEPIGQKMDTERIAMRRILQGQTVGISLRYLRAVINELLAARETIKRLEELEADWRKRVEALAQDAIIGPSLTSLTAFRNVLGRASALTQAADELHSALATSESERTNG